MLERPVLRGKAFVYLLNSKLQISQSTLTSHVSDSWDRIMISSIRSVTVSKKFSENKSMYTHTHTHTSGSWIQAHVPTPYTQARRNWGPFLDRDIQNYSLNVFADIQYLLQLWEAWWVACCAPADTKRKIELPPGSRGHIFLVWKVRPAVRVLVLLPSAPSAVLQWLGSWSGQSLTIRRGIQGFHQRAPGFS